jgi:NtrC-family two-component system response regulator AlgB
VLNQAAMVQLAAQSGANLPGYRPRVLVVERETRVRLALSHCLEALNCAVVITSTIGDALDAVEHRSFDLAFVDPSIEIELGRDLGSRLLDEMPGLTLVLITSCTTFGTALSERLRSSCEHVPAAFTPGQIKHIVERFCEQRLLRLRVAEVDRRMHAFGSNNPLIAESAAMRAALESAASAASSDALVVLCGERGTGRETLARFIHRGSSQAAGPFVAVNLLGVSEECVASELFGLGRRVSSGVYNGHAGLVEAADDGILFLREVDAIPSGLEAPLLRLFEHKDFERVGELRIRHSSARIVATSQAEFRFLTSRLGDYPEKDLEVVHIHVPPLRDRCADIVPLARMFLEGFARSMRLGALAFTAAAEAAFAAYPWPGNIPELRNVIERAVILHRAPTIDMCDLPECIAWSAERIPQIGGDFTVDEIEHEHIRRVVSRAESEVAATKILRISRSTLWRKRVAATNA